VPEIGANIQAITARQHQIEHDQIEPAVAGLSEA